MSVHTLATAHVLHVHIRCGFTVGVTRSTHKCTRARPHMLCTVRLVPLARVPGGCQGSPVLLPPLSLSLLLTWKNPFTEFPPGASFLQGSPEGLSPLYSPGYSGS